MSSFCADPVIELKLANLSEDLESKNREVVLSFYGALESGNSEAVLGLLASNDLEWSFHGPAEDQHLMRFLTGAASHDRFSFKPVTLCAIGDNVFVEGQSDASDRKNCKCWIHVWTLKEGKIVQLREYINTELIVVGPIHDSLWKSQLGKGHSKSLPSLILSV
ncbi:hypothetical protein KP509_39G007800 [Ceratopteris richardii]|nr:hypothetical protein KP509_39G007800 [Ceratopteris richardii]